MTRTHTVALGIMTVAIYLILGSVSGEWVFNYIAIGLVVFIVVMLIFDITIKEEIDQSHSDHERDIDE